MNLILLQGSAPVPLTGYLVCYVPLAAIVIGLIAFFVLTDRDASRPYRRLNPFTPAPAAPRGFVASGAGSAAPVALAATGVEIAFVEANPAGSDLAGEYVRIVNGSGAAVNLAGWKLQDGGKKHTFTFPALVLAPGAEVRLWSKAGTNDAANLYWGSRHPIWNNTGDTAVLLGADGTVVSRFSYGA